MSTYRTFIAIEIPADIRRRIKEHIEQLRAACPDVRVSWTREDNLHLTLKFLGDVPVARIPALANAVTEAGDKINPFDLIVSGCGTFPPRGRPKVLWIGVDPGSADVLPASSSLDAGNADVPSASSSAGSAGIRPASFSRDAANADVSSAPSLPPSSLPLSSLHAAVENHCAAAGFEREPRAFHPHLTIARLRDSKGSRKLAEYHRQLGLTQQTFTVSELVVFRSELSDKGSKHTALSRHRLG